MGWKTAFVINRMEWLSHPATIGGVALPANSKTRKRSKRGKKAKSNRGVNQALVKSLAHELRAEILAILNERMASPNELAKELGEGLSQVSYHVKVLKDYEVIRLVKTEPRRGAVEHYYRATSRAYLTDRDWHELPDSVRVGMSADLFQEWSRRRRCLHGGRQVRQPRGSSPQLDPAHARRERLDRAAAASRPDAQAGAEDQHRRRAKASPNRKRTASRLPSP